MSEEAIRAEAAELGEKLSGLSEQIISLRATDIQASLEQRSLAEIQKTNPRVKSPKTAVKRAKQREGASEGKNLYDDLQESLLNELREQYKNLTTERDRLIEDRKLLLSKATPSPGEDWYPLDEVWVSTYRTQGFGANSYAQSSAKLRLESYQNGSPEIAMRVRYEKEPLEEYILEAQVDSVVEAEIVRFRAEESSLRDTVKSMWAKGVNPRVYLPMLPHGYEEANGLDFFGNDLREKELQE